MSPRLASQMHKSPAARAEAMRRSNAPRPDAPWRSKKATWGLMAGITPANASTQRSQNASSPLGSSGSPHDSSSAADGSIPAHSGPAEATAATSRWAKVFIGLLLLALGPTTHRDVGTN